MSFRLRFYDLALLPSFAETLFPFAIPNPPWHSITDDLFILVGVEPLFPT